MSALRPDKARPVGADDPVLGCSTLTRPHHASAYQIRIAANGPSADQWARLVFQDAPPALRLFLVLGWRMVLRVQLAPVTSHGHVLGWTLEARSSTSATMGVRSPLMGVQKVLRVDRDRLVVATFVRFDRPAARLLWTVVLPIHRLLEPALLTNAVARASQRPT